MSVPPPPAEGFSVLVFDMARTGEPDGERVVPGFATLAEARAYAEARVRSSVEELRGEKTGPAELRSLWFLYGEDCRVIGDGFVGSAEIDLYIAVPATPAECDWPALTPWLKRFHVAALAGNAAGETVWVGGFLNRYLRPSHAVLLALFAEDARQALARHAHADTLPTSLHTAHLFELANPPLPMPDGRPLRRWRVDVDFVCHDVKFGSSAGGVFEWPEEPPAPVLQTMANLLMGDKLALRGDGPDYVGYSDILGLKVAETDQPADYPANPVETPFPDDPVSAS